MSRYLIVLLTLVILSTSWIGASPAPVQAESMFQVTPIAAPDLKVDPNGTGQFEFTILNPTFTGDVEIGIENIHLTFEPKLVPVEAGVNKKVKLVLYGDASTGSWFCTGKITLLPKVGDMVIGGYKLPTTVFHEIPGEALLPCNVSKSNTLTILVEGEGVTDPEPGEHAYGIGYRATLTAQPEKGWKFERWIGDVKDPESAMTTVILMSDMTVTAVFKDVGPAVWPMITGSVAAAFAVLLALFFVLVRRRKKIKKPQPSNA
ncbi:MAG: hypothetical protein HQ553_04345 [Chloroflexi bacterium]|nr:hypothetical protein [Chloroflexota bacterium]